MFFLSYCLLAIAFRGEHTVEEDSDRREGKGRRCCLGDVLECRTSHLAARMILRKGFGRKSLLGGTVVWCGVTWKIIHFSEAFIPPGVHFSFHPFLQIILALNL